MWLMSEKSQFYRMTRRSDCAYPWTLQEFHLAIEAFTKLDFGYNARGFYLSSATRIVPEQWRRVAHVAGGGGTPWWIYSRNEVRAAGASHRGDRGRAGEIACDNLIYCEGPFYYRHSWDSVMSVIGRIERRNGEIKYFHKQFSPR